MTEYFPYGEKEIAWLKSRDARLGEAIDRIGAVRREVFPDLFAALVHSVVGQQISSKAHAAVWARLRAGLGVVDPAAVNRATAEELRGFGISFRKAAYIKNAAAKAESGAFDFAAIAGMSDADAVAKLCELDGIGTWSAEMLLLFSLRRPDILSRGDFGICRGLRMLHRHRALSRELFEKYRRRYSPYGSTASLYLWAIAGGAIEGMQDPAAPKKRKKKQ